MIVERCRDPEILREFLNQDAGESAYALGDLEPTQWERSEFWGAYDDEKIRGTVLLYHGFSIPILTMHGHSDSAKAVLEAIELPDEVFCLLPERFEPVVGAYFDLHHVYALWRMTVNPGNFRPRTSENDRLLHLGADDAARLNEFYQLAAEPGEELFAFSEEQVEQGVFYGIARDGNLLAAAGTHIVSVEENVASVGNVMTVAEFRGQGLGTAVTSAVTQHLFDTGITRVVLNVRRDNVPAIRVYERLGYEIYCPMVEGPAPRRL